MQIIGIILVCFGILVILVPELLSLLVGLVLIFIGANILFFAIGFGKGKNQSIKFGSYEIFKNKK